MNPEYLKKINWMKLNYINYQSIYLIKFRIKENSRMNLAFEMKNFKHFF